MPKLTSCKSCGKEVAYSAKTCPHCGQKLKSGWLPWILGGFVVLGLVCCGVPAIFTGLLGVGLNQQKIAAEKKVQEEKPIEVSASQLWQEFKANEVKANDTYKGKVVQVSGVIHRITQDEVEIDAGNLAKVNCSFSGDEQKKLASLSSGVQITIKGICDRQAILPGVNLSACKFVGDTAQKVEQPKNQDSSNLKQAPIKLTAARLLGEYKDNEAKANNSYKGKRIQVSGTIKRITENWVELKGAGRFEFLTVDCFLDRNVMASLSSGGEITVIGTCDGKNFAGINIRDCELVK